MTPEFRQIILTIMDEAESSRQAAAQPRPSHLTYTEPPPPPAHPFEDHDFRVAS